MDGESGGGMDGRGGGERGRRGTNGLGDDVPSPPVNGTGRWLRLCCPSVLRREGMGWCEWSFAWVEGCQAPVNEGEEVGDGCACGVARGDGFDVEGVESGDGGGEDVVEMAADERGEEGVGGGLSEEDVGGDGRRAVGGSGGRSGRRLRRRGLRHRTSTAHTTNSRVSQPLTTTDEVVAAAAAGAAAMVKVRDGRRGGQRGRAADGSGCPVSPVCVETSTSGTPGRRLGFRCCHFARFTAAMCAVPAPPTPLRIRCSCVTRPSVG